MRSLVHQRRQLNAKKNSTSFHLTDFCNHHRDEGKRREGEREVDGGGGTCRVYAVTAALFLLPLILPPHTRNYSLVRLSCVCFDDGTQRQRRQLRQRRTRTDLDVCVHA